MVVRMSGHRNALVTREVRLYVSLQPRDMSEEREHFFAKVKEHLQKACENVQATLTVVDVRHGVSSGAAIR